MNNFLINKFLQQRFAYVIATFIYIFIFYIIFEHVFDLTKLVFQYNSAFDYGKYIKTACDNEFFEYETERFHVNNNADNMKLSNTSNNNKYLTLILVITIIMTLFVSTTFSYILYNTFFNKDWFYTMLDIKLDSFEKGFNNNQNFFQRAFAYIIYTLTLLYSIPKILFGLFYKLFISQQNDAMSFLINIILFAIVTIIYLLIGSVVVIMPVYIGLKLGLNIDISPFNTNYEVYIGYIIAFSLIVIIRLLFLYFRYSDGYIERNNPITNYFSTNVSQMYTANNVAGYIAFFTIFAVYILMFYILGNVINLYQNKNFQTLDEDQDEDQDQNEANEKNQDIIKTFFKKTFGYSEYNNYQMSNVFVKNMSGVSFTLIIVIIVMIFVYIIANVTGANDNVHRLFKYGIITPLTFITMIIMISATTMEFNSMINEYILEIPYTMYKQYIDLLNKKFNILLNNEYNSVESFQPQYVCRNIGNAILVTLYNELFDNIPKLSRTGDDNAKLIDITPEFKYNRSCDISEPFDFKDRNEYDMMYYIQGKEMKKNIFYNYTKCSEVNTPVLESLTKNLQIFDYAQLAKIVTSIQKVFYTSKPLKTKDPIQYIKVEIVESNMEANISIENLRNTLKRKLHKSIFNVKNNFTFSDINKSLITHDNDTYFQDNTAVDITELEIHTHNNKIGVKLSKSSAEQIVKEYETIVDEVIEVYLENIYHFLYTFTPFFIKLNINQNTTGISKDNDKYQELQDIFIKKLSNGISQTFDRINEKLTTPLTDGKDKKLSTYIIANYNAIHRNNIYKREQFYMIKSSSFIEADKSEEESKSKAKHIEIFDQIFITFWIIFEEELKPLILYFKSNEYKNVKFIFSLNQIKNKIGTVKEELNKYKFDKSFTTDVNSLFKSENNKYITSYETQNVESKQKEIIVIDNTFVTFDKMMELSIVLLLNMENKYNLLISSYTDSEKIQQYSANIDKYVNIIDTNTYCLNNDIVLYLDYNNNTNNVPITMSDMSVDLSRSILKDTKRVDQMIYYICFYYIISITLTNFIYNI